MTHTAHRPSFDFVSIAKYAMHQPLWASADLESFDADVRPGTNGGDCTQTLRGLATALLTCSPLVDCVAAVSHGDLGLESEGCLSHLSTSMSFPTKKAVAASMLLYCANGPQ